MALRDSATMCVTNILSHLSSGAENEELVKLFVIENLLPQIKTGIRLKTEVKPREREHSQGPKVHLFSEYADGFHTKRC